MRRALRPNKKASGVGTDDWVPFAVAEVGIDVTLLGDHTEISHNDLRPTTYAQRPTVNDLPSRANDLLILTAGSRTRRGLRRGLSLTMSPKAEPRRGRATCAAEGRRMSEGRRMPPSTLPKAEPRRAAP